METTASQPLFYISVLKKLRVYIRTYDSENAKTIIMSCQMAVTLLYVCKSQTSVFRSLLSILFHHGCLGGRWENETI